jgi:hypothetical protein
MPDLAPVMNAISFQSPVGNISSIGKYGICLIAIFVGGFILVLIARRLKLTGEAFEDEFYS